MKGDRIWWRISNTDKGAEMGRNDGTVRIEIDPVPIFDFFYIHLPLQIAKALGKLPDLLVSRKPPPNLVRLFFFDFIKPSVPMCRKALPRADPLCKIYVRSKCSISFFKEI